jgi:O-antigen ligase
MFNYLWLFGLAWVAVFTSQSLVDASDILICITALVALYKKQDFKIFLEAFKPTGFWLIWIAVLIVGLVPFFSLHSFAAFQPMIEFKWIFSFLCLIYLLKESDLHKLYIDVVPAIVSLLNTLALFFYFQRQEDRAGGVLNQVMAFAHNIGPTFVLLLLIGLFQLRTLKKSQKHILIYSIFSSGFLTLLTITRGVWIGVIISIFIGTFLWNRKVFLATVVSFIFVLSAAVAISPEIRDRLTQNPLEAAGSNYIRRALIKANWDIALENPFFGVGLENNKKLLPEKYKKMGYSSDLIISHAHNQYLEFFANTGVLGLFCYLFFIFRVISTALITFYSSQLPQLKQKALAFSAAILCFAVGGLTECNFNVSKNRYFFLILMASAVALYYQNKEISLKNQQK